MGVYVFRSKHEPYIKVGHYCGQNVWSRIAHRGFSSCVCPSSLVGRVTLEDVELVAWFPSLSKKQESAVKKRWKEVRVYQKSEWFPSSCESDIVQFLEQQAGGEGTNEKDQCCLQEALSTRRRL